MNEGLPLRIVRSTISETQSKFVIDVSIPSDITWGSLNDYIPLSVTWGDRDYTSTLYWRTGDFKKSLIEIGIESKTGRIQSFTLTLAKKLNLNRDDRLDIKVPIINGLPVINRKHWPEDDRFFDKIGEFQLILNENAGRIYIVFNQDQVVKWIKSDRVLFGLNEKKKLALLGVQGIDDTEVKRFKNNLLR